MPLRMPARLLATAGALALAASLSSCGFDYATDRIYDVTAGTTNRDAGVDVLSAVVVSGQKGSGTLITSFSNNDQNASATVTGISGAGGSSDLQVQGFQPIDIAGGELVNLAEQPSPVIVKAPDLEAGDFVTLDFTFASGSTEDVDVPVVPACYEWKGLDKSAPGGTTATGSIDQCDVPKSEYYPETGIPSNE